MKILFLTNPSFSMPAHSRGGARFLVNICKEMCSRGNRVDVLSISDKIMENQSEDEPYRVINCNRSARFSSVLPNLKSLELAKNKYDLFFMGILVTTGAFGMYLICRLLRAPFVMLLHGFDMDYLQSKFFFDRYFTRLYLRNADLILVNSAATGMKAVSHGACPSKVKVLNPGVDTKLFCKKNNLEPYLDKHRLNGKKVILTVSRLVKRKGHSSVIEAVARLKNEIPDIHYLVVGEGPENQNLGQFARESGVSDKVSFVGPVHDNELPYYYSLSKVFVMPTITDGNDYEGFGMVYLEANACGLPVIGSRSGGVADAIVDGETGILVDEYDVIGLSEAIKKILQDDALRAKMGEIGRKRAEALFSWKMIGNKLETYLRECTAKN
jgi:phosphatidylinositol alpha-1,6-mannosyltransferase